MELFEFRFSTYNEKVRWALDFKGIVAASHPQLPGLHAATIRGLSGQTATPVLRDSGEVIAGSAEIIAHLENRHPGPSLMPSSSNDQREALEWQRWLDDEVGAKLRYALFADVLGDAQFSGKAFSLGAKPFKGRVYRACFPMMASVLRRKLDVTETKAAQARDVASRALDRIAARTAASEYLVGRSFSVADLTAASIFFPTCFPPELELDLPLDGPSISTWIDRWSGHPAMNYVRRMYRRHRRTQPKPRLPD